MLQANDFSLLAWTIFHFLLELYIVNVGWMSKLILFIVLTRLFPIYTCLLKFCPKSVFLLFFSFAFRSVHLLKAVVKTFMLVDFRVFNLSLSLYYKHWNFMLWIQQCNQFFQKIIYACWSCVEAIWVVYDCQQNIKGQWKKTTKSDSTKIEIFSKLTTFKWRCESYECF